MQFSVSISRRTLRYALVTAIVLAVLAPVAVFAVGGTFTDDDDSVFEDNIEWMAANGITSGCGPDIYCPDDNVTRGQMAAFMERLATNKVVDAATAVDAEMVGGMTAAELMAGQPIGVGLYGQSDITGTAITGIDRPMNGVYCLTIDPALELTLEDVIVQIAVEWGASSGFDLFAYWSKSNVDCPAGDIEVRTYQFSIDGDGDVDGVELSSSVAWSYVIWHRPDVPELMLDVVTDAPENADR